MPTLDHDGDVWLLNLGSDENRFNPGMLAGLNACLDEIERASGPRALVTRAEGKFWSTGLDLDWMLAHADQAGDNLAEVQLVLARFLLLPVATVAALSGHAFGAGAMLSCAHDQAVMREDRGYWCLPEVDLGLPFTLGMDALVRSRLPVRTAHQAMTTGHRYGGPEAVTAGAVDEAAREDRVLPAAIERAAPLAAKAGPALGAIKARMYAAVVTALREPPGDPFAVAAGAAAGAGAASGTAAGA